MITGCRLNGDTRTVRWGRSTKGFICDPPGRPGALRAHLVGFASAVAALPLCRLRAWREVNHTERSRQCAICAQIRPTRIVLLQIDSLEESTLDHGIFFWHLLLG